MADYTCPQCGGESDAAYAEANWKESGACSVYCDALEGGASEEEAQEARGQHSEKVGQEEWARRLDEARALLDREGEL